MGGGCFPPVVLEGGQQFFVLSHYFRGADSLGRALRPGYRRLVATLSPSSSKEFLQLPAASTVAMVPVACDCDNTRSFPTAPAGCGTRDKDCLSLI